jgi:predicted metalloendopeptidase
MTDNTIKKISNLKNKTIKRKDISLKPSHNFTSKQKDILCKTSSNTYNTFEDKVDELFKKNKIDVVSTSFNLEKLIVSELKEAVNPTGVQPNQDFYSYINDRWITDYELTEQQQYIVQVDDFRITQDKVYRELIMIIEEFLSKPQQTNNKQTQCIKNAYESFKGYNTNEQTRCLSKSFVEYNDEIMKNKSNLWLKIGTINRNEVTSWGCPFVWSINPDDKNPKKYRCYLEPPQLSLIDIDVYFDDDTDTEEEKKYKKKYRNEYFKYCRR